MTRSHALALSGAALLALLSSPSFAQAMRSGMQCVPDVANASMYQNCRLRLVAGQEVCRCAIRPQAFRRSDQVRNQDQDVLATGSVHRSLTGRGSQFGEGTLGTGAAIGGGSIGNGATGGAVGGGSTGGGSTDGSAGGDVSGGAVGGDSGLGHGPGNNNGLGDGSEPADNTDTDVKGTDPSNPGGGGGSSNAGRGGGNGGNSGDRGGNGSK